MLQYLKTDTLRCLMVSLMAVMTLSLYAQQTDPANESKADDDPFGPTFMPMVKVGKVLEGGDSIQYMEMNNVYVYPPISFSSKKQQMAFNRLVRNVKRVLPIAKEARTIMMETAEFLETLPDKKSKEEHMKRVEKSIWKEYQPKMKKTDVFTGKTPHQTHLSRESFIFLQYDSSLSRTCACWILSGFCMGVRRQFEERIRSGRCG